jgi:hypothetical protein
VARAGGTKKAFCEPGRLIECLVPRTLANVERAISSWIMTRPIRRNFEHHFLSRRCALAWLAYSRVIQHRHSPDRSEIQRTWDAAK